MHVVLLRVQGGDVIGAPGGAGGQVGDLQGRCACFKGLHLPSGSGPDGEVFRQRRKDHLPPRVGDHPICGTQDDAVPGRDQSPFHLAGGAVGKGLDEGDRASDGCFQDPLRRQQVAQQALLPQLQHRWGKAGLHRAGLQPLGHVQQPQLQRAVGVIEAIAFHHQSAALLIEGEAQVVAVRGPELKHRLRRVCHCQGRRHEGQGQRHAFQQAGGMRHHDRTPCVSAPGQLRILPGRIR